MIYGSVCSGIEAASCAWHPLGWRAAFLSEITSFPKAVLMHHYPDVPLHGDFTTIQVGQYEPINLLVGGTPCQSFSSAGLRGGLADERGNLALEYLRLADRLKPRWLVWENVPGVLSSNGGRDFGSFLGGLVKLGYGFSYRVLDAQYFGLAQRRKRVFVVGYFGDWRHAAAVLFEPSSFRKTLAPERNQDRTFAFDAELSKDFNMPHDDGIFPCLIKKRGYYLAYKNYIRRALPIEYERAQGFPDGYTDITYRGSRAAHAVRFAALGNSMAVPCMAWIGHRIAAQESVISQRIAA